MAVLTSELEPVTWLQATGLSDASEQDKYIASMYWAFTTMTTVGYGDISPQSSQEQIYSIFVMILACGVFAYTVGSIGNLISISNHEAAMQ